MKWQQQKATHTHTLSQSSCLSVKNTNVAHFHRWLPILYSRISVCPRCIHIDKHSYARLVCIILHSNIIVCANAYSHIKFDKYIDQRLITYTNPFYMYELDLQLLSKEVSCKRVLAHRFGNWNSVWKNLLATINESFALLW